MIRLPFSRRLSAGAIGAQSARLAPDFTRIRMEKSYVSGRILPLMPWNPIDMKTTHAGLGITEKDWDGSVKHLVGTLDKFKVPAKEKDDVLAAVSTLKKDIVEKP